MDKIKDGGPEFPFVEPSTECNVATGMSLRDYFAAKALAGMLADPKFDADLDDAAHVSYCYADAMLRARGAV